MVAWSSRATFFCVDSTALGVVTEVTLTPPSSVPASACAKNFSDFGQACAENTGELLEHVDTVSAARDLDLLRAVLGDRKLNYLGYSYGTFLGATFAGLYPEKVGRLVLDGAIDPSVSGLDVNVTQGVGFESALRAYMQTCLGGDDCPFNGTVDDGMADLGTLLASTFDLDLPLLP